MSDGYMRSVHKRYPFTQMNLLCCLKILYHNTREKITLKVIYKRNLLPVIFVLVINIVYNIEDQLL